MRRLIARIYSGILFSGPELSSEKVHKMPMNDEQFRFANCRYIKFSKSVLENLLRA